MDPELEQTAEEAHSALAQLFTSQHVVYAEKTSDEIRQMGRRSAAIKMDVTNREQIREVFATIKKDFGSIDILVNNAGTLDHIAQIEHQNDELWDRDLRVNLSGAFNCTKAAWPYMREQGWGRVIYMASVAGTLGGFGQASYAATKLGHRSRQVDGARGRAIRHHREHHRAGNHRHGGVEDGRREDERSHGAAHRDAQRW